MRKSLKVPAAVAVASAICMMAAIPAIASSVHLKGGANAKPSFVDNGLRLTESGALSGLGAGNVSVNLSAQAAVTATCSNKGTNEAPGQNPAPITVTGSQFIPADSIDKNGNVPFSVTTTPPASTISGAPGYPNSNWTETIKDLSFTSATLTVLQPANSDGSGGTLVLTVTCTFSPATSNGPVPSGTVTCTSS
jgi:hypothetical protein